MMKVQVSRASQSVSGPVRFSSAHTLSHSSRSTTTSRSRGVARVSYSTKFVASATPLALFSKSSFHSSKCTKDEAVTSHTTNASRSSKPQPPRHSDVGSNSSTDRRVTSNVNIVQPTEQNLEGIAAVETTADIKPPALTGSSVSEAHFQHGFHLYEAGRVEDAVKSLQAAVQYNPEHGRAHHFLGVALANGGKHKQAIDHFLKSTKLAPQEDKTVQESWYQLGQSYIALQQFQNVVFAMDKMIKVNSNDPSVHYNRGYALMMLEIFDYAIRCLDVVLHIDSKHLSALQCKAYCYIQQKKYTQALELLETASEINPQHATTLAYKQYARKMFMRQKGVYAFEEVFPTSPERQKQLPVRFRRTLLTSVLLRPT